MSDEQTAVKAAFARQRAAMAVTGTTGPEKAVLLVLAMMANENGQAWPPIRGTNGLVSRCSLGERTVVRALRGLEAAGLVTTKEISGKGSIYTIGPCRSGSPPLPERQGLMTPPLPERQATPARATAKQSETIVKRKKTSSSTSTRNAAASSAGSRLSPDFIAPPDWLAWATAERGWTQRDAAAEADEFRDYWIAQPGGKGRKADWPATWRNWVRRSRRSSSIGGQHGRRTDRILGGGGAGYVRDRPVDGFAAALREMQAGGDADHAGGG